METADLQPLVEDVTSNIDDLEESLAPLLGSPLFHSTSKLPLLDKAKLYVLVTYSIESILFSSLRLNGVDAKSHPVFKELVRVKEYFGKIKAAETAGAKRSSTLDKDAANRFIKHGLAGNEKLDRERTERTAREKAGAKRKFDDIQLGTHTRFDDSPKRVKIIETEQHLNGTGLEGGTFRQDKSRASAQTTGTEANGGLSGGESEAQAAKRLRKFERRLARHNADDVMPESAVRAHAGDNEGDGEDEVNSDMANRSTKAPKTSQEALEALLDVSSPTTDKKKHKKKKKSKGQKLEDERADEMR